MASDSLAGRLRDLNLTEEECLTFQPSEDTRSTPHDTPRHLFRVFTPKSRGITSETWAKSMDAKSAAAQCGTDIFARANKHNVAEMINRHLRWWEGSSDNLVSWTTSLLFALVYIFHLRANIRNSSTFADIQLCILDTSCFPQGVFLQDMDLIRAYKRFNSQLTELGSLRLRPHRQLPEFYYFGEYLSQGALKIEGKCQIVSAQAMIDRGLYTFLPQLEDFARWEVQAKPPWASAVIELRHELYANVSERQRTSCDGLKAIIDVSELFGRGWRMPMAINLLALSTYRSDGNNILPLLRTFTSMFPSYQKTAADVERQ